MSADAQNRLLDATTAARGGPAWLAGLREQGRARFAEVGLPTPRIEEWKYTNVAPLQRHAFAWAERSTDLPAPTELERFLYPELRAHLLVFVDGHYAPELSSPGTMPAGCHIGGLAAAIEQGHEGIEAHLGRAMPESMHGFTALNTAGIADGAFVYLSAGAAVEAPIHLLFLATERATPALVQPRNLIVAAEGARATLIESYAALGQALYLTNAVTEIFTGPAASIEHYKLQQESAQAFHIAGIFVHEDRDSRYVSHSLSLGGMLVRNDLQARLDAEGSACTLNGLYIACGRQHVDHHTVVDHLKPHGTSQELYKGVLEGRSRAVFNGRVVVHPGAQHTDAKQRNNNLLLSEDAEVDTKPELEIYADDVKCAHGATVGQLDEDAVYYLRSRAIDDEAARSLLIYAFANEILTRVGLAPVRRQLQQFLTDRLLHGHRVEELQ